MKTLISMTDFVLQQYSNNYHANTPTRILNYARFLKQPLKLEMFVPCDEDGNVLEEPKGWSNGECDIYDCCSICCCEQYKKAKEKVLFEGFEYIETENYFFVFNEEKLVRLQRSNFKTETVEFIAGQEVELTSTALKQIGL